MADVALYENLPRIILNKLRANLGDSNFATYWDGDPVMIGKSQMPALIVDWEDAQPLQAPTRHDKWQQQITVKVVLNKMDDVNTSEAGGKGILIEVPTKKRLERFIFARDKTTREYLPDTVLGVLRKEFSMGGKTSDQVARVQFGISERPGDNANIMVTAEAHVILNATELIAVTGRR